MLFAEFRENLPDRLPTRHPNQITEKPPRGLNYFSRIVNSFAEVNEMIPSFRFALLLLTGSALFGIRASASEIGALTARVAKSPGHHLSITFQDVEDQPQRCPLTVRRMEYLASLSALVVDLSADSCALDVMGKRKGTVHWDLPLAIRAKGKLKLIVQGKSLGFASWEGEEAIWTP